MGTKYINQHIEFIQFTNILQKTIQNLPRVQNHHGSIFPYSKYVFTEKLNNPYNFIYKFLTLISLGWVIHMRRRKINIVGLKTALYIYIYIYIYI